MSEAASDTAETTAVDLVRDRFCCFLGRERRQYCPMEKQVPRKRMSDSWR
jgi:hypothetical protein